MKNATSYWHLISAIPPNIRFTRPPPFPSPYSPPPSNGNLGIREGWRRLLGGGTESGILGDREPSEPGGGACAASVASAETPPFWFSAVSRAAGQKQREEEG